MERKPRPGRQGEPSKQSEPQQKRPAPDLRAQTGGLGRGGDAREGGLVNRFEPDPYTLIDLFRKDFHGTEHLAFARNLEDTGLLVELEQAGILPTVQDADSLDDELQELQPESWCQKPPAEQNGLLNSLEQRDLALRYLYVGAILGHLFHELFIFPDKEP